MDFKQAKEASGDVWMAQRQIPRRETAWERFDLETDADIWCCSRATHSSFLGRNRASGTGLAGTATPFAGASNAGCENEVASKSRFEIER